MKRRRVIFILPIVSLIVLSLNICSFAMNTGFSTSEPDEKKQQYFLSGNAISLTYEEPKKYIISCFDVSESGLVAVGSATYGNQYIYVYDATGKFQYGYAFNNPGSYGLQWDGSDLIIYFVRSDIAPLARAFAKKLLVSYITPLVPKHATYLPDESPSALAYRHPERRKTPYVRRAAARTSGD